MRLATWNVNGLRAIFRHGFLDWMQELEPDVVCLQETKISSEQLPEELLHPLGYRSYWHSAQKRGYSGVVTYCRQEPLWVLEGLGMPEFDLEGRVLTTEWDRLMLVNAYFPNSQADQTRLEYKVEFCQAMLVFLRNLGRRGKPVVVCGDFNIAHREIDLYNPELSGRSSGYLPEERECLDQLLAAGFVDVFRSQHPEGGHYTWWSYTPGVREKNLGWRIDYFLASQGMEGLGRCFIQPQVLGSDHCPVVLELTG